MKILTVKKLKGDVKRVSSVKTNIYCYSVIKGTFIKNESFKGIDNIHELYSISHKDVSMVVSKVDQCEFSEKRLKEAVEDMMWLGQYAMRHEEIVESIMKVYTPLLPMKFCTIYEDEARINMILESRYSEFADQLSYLKDKEEYGVKIYLNKNIFKKVIKSKKWPVIVEEREPLVDLFDEEKVFKIFVELPGVTENEIHIELSGDILNISAKGRLRKYHKEILITAKIKPETMAKSFKNGILEITFEKR